VETGLVMSSMGIGEVGLNLFFEVPPVAPLIRLRRALHEDGRLRQEVLGADRTVPMLFTYDPSRIHVEFGEGGGLVTTTLDLRRQVPLIRYVPGDCGSFLSVSPRARAMLEAAGIAVKALDRIPIVMIHGRGRYVAVGGATIDPEQVKEGLYHDPGLARLTTANFRLASGEGAASVRIQLAPGIEAGRQLEEQFAEAISRYAGAPVVVSCERYEAFGSGMALEYERKFDYLGS
jgi:phenylacetate-CoA ligase